MDTENLINHARARFDHAAAKRLLREKYESKLIFGWQGGMFRAGPELITLLSLYDHDIVIKDLYDTPIKVNPQELINEAKARWQEQMNGWLIEFDSLSKQK
jgi:hypothetical protein